MTIPREDIDPENPFRSIQKHSAIASCWNASRYTFPSRKWLSRWGLLTAKWERGNTTNYFPTELNGNSWPSYCALIRSPSDHKPNTDRS